MSITEALNVLGPSTEISVWEAAYVLFLGLSAKSLLVARRGNQPLVTFMLVIPTAIPYFVVVLFAPSGLGAGYITTGWYLFVILMSAATEVYGPPLKPPRRTFLY